MKYLVSILAAILLSCTDHVLPPEEVSERCSLQPETGPCRALIKKYYYDREEKRCREFVWGGCGGVVPFETMEACVACEELPTIGDGNYLIFGHSYGFCEGEQCVEIFLMKDNGLWEDSSDKFPSSSHTYDGDFSINRTDKLNLVKSIWASIPQKLYEEEDNVIGCPDCTDGGLVYIELKKDGEVHFWVIDSQRAPDYLQSLVNAVHEKVELLQ